jgi:hypothetical protein
MRPNIKSLKILARVMGAMSREWKKKGWGWV